MEIDHHLRDAALGGRDARSLRVEAKLMAQGSLNAFPIEDFEVSTASSPINSMRNRSARLDLYV
jgi:hypothetical protein